ncbi:hypothetical protein [Mycobacterium sp. 23]|uniref:hypothetical protein n=1 Tax=Mycobacterium sp. 23 TaxID=3400424 RepID=UPI003AAB2AB7
MPVVSLCRTSTSRPPPGATPATGITFPSRADKNLISAIGIMINSAAEAEKTIAELGVLRATFSTLGCG